MNFTAVVIGLVIACFTVITFRNSRLEHKGWAYPLLLASFPLYYFVFAVYASDYHALKNELFAGLLFFGVAYVGYKSDNSIGIFLLAAGFIGHAVYDVVHNYLFTNNGTPIWWPEFCGAVDLLIGLYLLFLAVMSSLQRKAFLRSNGEM